LSRLYPVDNAITVLSMGVPRMEPNPLNIHLQTDV